MIILDRLFNKFRNNNNIEYSGTLFLTNVPSVAPFAYLNIIFPAADKEIQERKIDSLHLPVQLREYYFNYNGAVLLSDTINIFGFRPNKYLLERDDWRKILPMDLIEENQEYYGHMALSKLLLIGYYSPDVSYVGLERPTGKVYCCEGRNIYKIRASWPSFDIWLESELKRLVEYFDEYGNRLVEQEEMLPG